MATTYPRNQPTTVGNNPQIGKFKCDPMAGTMDQRSENSSTNYEIFREDTTQSQAPKIYEQLGDKRRHIAWTARLRTKHCSLNEYLEQFNIIDQSECECRQGKETLRHFLLVFQRYERERDELRKKVGMQGMRVEKLLGDAKRIKNARKI